MKTFRDYIDLVTQLHEAPNTVVPGGGSITNVDPNSAEGKAMIARSQAVQAGKSPDSAAPAPGQTATPAPAAAAPAAAPKTWNKGVLGKGMKGPEVSALQKKLGIADTGTYDAATIAAVQALQKKLGVSADGAYGPGTKAAHDKMPPEQAATPAPAPIANQADAGQPQFGTGATADQVQTGAAKGAANAAVRSSTTTDPGQTSLNARVTTAIPTTPVNPANPGGATSKATITPDQARAALANGSERDIQAFGGKERLQQLAGVTPAAPATGGTPAAPATNAATLRTAQNQASGAAPAATTAAPAPAPAANNASSSYTGAPAAAPAPAAAAAPAAADEFLDAPVASSALTPQQRALAQSAGFATNRADATAMAQRNLAAAQSGDTAGGASLARPVVPATGARAQVLQRQQAQNQMPESRDTQYQKELNAMLRIANLPDKGL